MKVTSLPFMSSPLFLQLTRPVAVYDMLTLFVESVVIAFDTINSSVHVFLFVDDGC